MTGRLNAFPAALAAACLVLVSNVATQPAKRPMTLVDLLNIPRVGDPQMSPDGRQVTFTLATTDWPGNQRIPSLWRIDVDGGRLP